MTSFLIAVFAALVGALLYRIRGGWLPTGSTQTARLIWALPTGLLIGLLSGSVILGLLTVISSFVALLNPHGRWFDIGHADGNTHTDTLIMCLLGVGRMFITLLPVIVVNPFLAVFTLFGLLHGLVYYYGWTLPLPEKIMGKWYNPVDASTAYGELMWGAVQYAVFVMLFI